MTEPPESRRPGEGDTDWDGMERDAVRDFVADATPDMQEAIDAARAQYGDEQFDEMVAEVLRRANDPMRYTADLEELAEDEAFEELDDDVLLDALGSGEDPDEGELADMLGAWRDDVDSVPASPGTSPETVQEIHDFTQEIDRATAPPRSTEGAAPSMPISDVIATLTMVAEGTTAVGTLQSAETTIRDDVLPALLQAVAEIAERNNTASQALEGNPNSQAEAQSVGEHAAGAIEDAIELVNAAAQAVAGAIQHTQVFPQTLSQIAGRLAGG